MGDHHPPPRHSLLPWREKSEEDWSNQHNMSTRKAKYRRADTATQQTGRRSSARKAIEATYIDGRRHRNNLSLIQ